jgi:hypothetical protein
MSAQLALFPDLARTVTRPRGRPRVYSPGSIDLLERARARLALAADTGSHVLARQFAGQAADLLGRAGARDLARAVERALYVAVGHPDVDDLVDRIDRRIADRHLKDSGVV